MQVTLSDGTLVTLRDVWTHAVQREFDTAVFKVSPDVTSQGIYAAWEAVLPLTYSSLVGKASWSRTT